MEKNIPAANGLYMLVMQAVLAEALFCEGNKGLHDFCSNIPEENTENERNEVLQRLMREVGEREYQEILCKQMNLVLVLVILVII